jgi:hypothetical protein
MDEQKLADLFRDAAHDAPPASFDAGDVRTASRRATQRRRNSIAAGTTLVVVLGFGGVVAGNNWFDQTEKSVAGSGQQQDNAAQSPMTALEQAQPEKNFPSDDASTQGDTPAPGSTGLSTSAGAVQGCAGVDRELADALAGELSVSPDQAQPPTVTCSPDSRSASFKINDQTITAIVTPRSFEAPAGAPTEKAKTAKGQDLYVFTEGEGALKAQAKRYADALAPRF